MSTAAEAVAEFAIQTGTFLLIALYVIGYSWWLLRPFRELYQNWGSWKTYPVPEKRAILQILGTILFTAIGFIGLWFIITWYGL